MSEEFYDSADISKPLRVLQTPRAVKRLLDIDEVIKMLNAPINDTASLTNHITWKIYIQQHSLLKHKLETYTRGLTELETSIQRDQSEIKKAVNNYVLNGVDQQSAMSKAELNFPELDLNIQLKAKYNTIVEAIYAHPTYRVPPDVASFSTSAKGGAYEVSAIVNANLHLAMAELIKLKGVARKHIRSQLCAQILAFSQNYTVFTKGYSIYH